MSVYQEYEEYIMQTVDSTYLCTLDDSKPQVRFRKRVKKERKVFVLGRFNISSEKYAKYANCLLNLRSLWFLANTYFSQKSPGEYIFLQEKEVSTS